MFCSSCGTQLSDDANFCHKCGTPVGHSSAEEKGTQWEYCQVYRDWKEKGFSLFTSWVVWYYADALHPVKGKYIAMKSDQFTLSFDDWHYRFNELELPKNVLNEFAAQLIKDGWVPIPERGENFWQLCFKRRT